MPYWPMGQLDLLLLVLDKLMHQMLEEVPSASQQPAGTLQLSKV